MSEGKSILIIRLNVNVINILLEPEQLKWEPVFNRKTPCAF